MFPRGSLTFPRRTRPNVGHCSLHRCTGGALRSPDNKVGVVQIEEMRRQIIEEERQRLLQEHAAKLVGFLPKVRVHRSLSRS